MSKTNPISYFPYDDYAQSANTLFHFMKKEEYLSDILHRQAIVPRYCIETMDYLNIHRDNVFFREVAVLQKCFCDIPFHKLSDSFTVKGIGETYESLTFEEKIHLEKNNTHFDYYGSYAVAFSKKWGEEKGLQPVHYLNSASEYAKNFTSLFNQVFADDNLPDEYALDIINRLIYLKPVRGIMKRRITKGDSTTATVEIFKNFHDEKEWRFVPTSIALSNHRMRSIIAKQSAFHFLNEINQQLSSDDYSDLWLTFTYEDIKYIIVPDSNARKNVIESIMHIPDEKFVSKENIILQKSILASKILVLAEIRKDW